MNRYLVHSHKLIPPTTLRPLDRVKLSAKALDFYLVHDASEKPNADWRGTILRINPPIGPNDTSYVVRWDGVVLPTEELLSCYPQNFLEACDE
jgi:hypothetical protein